MSITQLTEYLLWKSIGHKTEPSLSENVTIKQEFNNKQEIFKDNVNMICRVCTNSAEIPITDKIEDTLIISAIRTVASISITEADYYPKYVCKMCLGELKIAFHFKRKCEASDFLFRKAISSQTVLATSPQPIIMHDFSLILHQMKQNRLVKSESVKVDDTNEIPSDSQTESIQETILIMPDINLSEPKKRNRKSVSVRGTTTHNRIINLLKNSSDLNIDDSNSKATSDNIKIQQHTVVTKEKNLPRLHKCRRCDLRFDTKDEYKKHRKENNCMYHACPLCGKLVLNLANHESIVHSRKNKYTCHQCGKIYYSSGALTNHMHKHKETKEYFCEHCPYRGKRKSYLVCHMRVHTGEHRYLCSMCPLKFTNPSNLTKHQLVHFNKKFECSKCKRLFRQERNLKEHYDAAHLNIRYRCSICSRELSSRRKLLSHELRVHKREKHKLFEEVQRVVVGNGND